MVKRWVRYVMPIMVEVDCDADDVLRVVTLPTEVRRDRDDRGQHLVYDESFVRRPADTQPEIHAAAVADPDSEHSWLAVEPPANWPKPWAWQEGFDLTETDDGYGETDPYGDHDR